MKYAVISLSGHQYKVYEGDVLKVDKLKNSEDPKVLMVSADGDVKVGDPYLDGVVVKVGIEKEELGKKVTIRRFKAKSRYHKTKGYRHSHTLVKILKINDSTELKKEVVKRGLKKAAKPKKGVI
ncbi:50S ribosomal protein L21 [candidate division WWE3 bacterium]|nr:50S ribosomal protein L21 [candidate division WWE3 bacterium]